MARKTITAETAGKEDFVVLMHRISADTFKKMLNAAASDLPAKDSGLLWQAFKEFKG